jgi:predicted DNA-binding antitoxin AbrB/MazE fold protein
MNQTTTAIYENGVLRPVVSLDLPEHSEVEITIHSSRSSFSNPVDRALRAANLTTRGRGLSGTAASAERRAELAELFSAETPLGDYIDEDRDR